MTGFENTLTEILTEEARRHEAPAFDAYAIADRASASRPRRRNRFALAAGIVAAAAVSAGAVYGLSGGSDTTGAGGPPPGPRLTMAFTRSGSDHTPITLAHLKQVVQARAAAAGIKAWTVDDSAGTVTVTVAGAPADRDRLSNIVAPGFVSVRPVVDPATFGLAAWAAEDCAKPLPPEAQAKLAAGGMDLVCAIDTRRRILVGASKVTGGEVASAKAVEGRTSQGVPTGQWEVDLTFSADGTKDFAELTSDAYSAGTQIAFVVGGDSYSEATVAEPITGAQAVITGQIGEPTAERLAVAVNAGPLPDDFELVAESTTP